MRLLVCGGGADWSRLRATVDALVRAGDGRVVVRFARDVAAGVDAAGRYDAVLAGGGLAAARSVAAPCHGRLVTWGGDLLDALAEAGRSGADALAAASAAVLCEDEDERGRVERRLPVRGRTLPWPGRPDLADARALLRMLGPAAPPGLHGRRLRVLFAGYDFKFVASVMGRLGRLRGCEVRSVGWRGLGSGVPPAAPAANAWADVVVCEWAGANAVWHAGNKRPGQRLIVHLHRFEVKTRWPAAVDWAAVDQLVAVSPHYAALLRARLPNARVVALANYADAAELDRAKTPGARFHLGLLGAVPKLKRLDRALDLLAEVRRRDGRYCLFVKSEMPWHSHHWAACGERDYYRRTLGRVRGERLLRGAVVFEPSGGDVAAWLRKIGTVLSTSDGESFHVAVAEGMMSGATAVVLPWPGADGVYGAPWVVPDIAAGAERVLAQADPDVWERRRRAARARVAPYELDRVFEAWANLLVADRDPHAWSGLAGRPR